ncbi:hypothetical protein OXX69_002594 [Metschnikowia pulcherrima]
MLLRRIDGLLRFSNSLINFRRCVFILSSERKRRADTKKYNPPKWPKRDEAKIRVSEQASASRAPKKVKDFVASVSDYVKHHRSPQTQNSEAKSLLTPHEPASEEKAESYRSHQSPRFDPSRSSLLTPAVDIPSSFQKKLGPALKFLVSKEHQNWSLALKQIENAGGFHDEAQIDIRKLVYNIPKKQLVLVFPQIERLLQEAGIPKSPKIINAYLKGLVAGGSISDERIQLMENYVAEMRSFGKKSRLSRESYEILIEAYGKSRNIAKMEGAINAMRALGLTSTPNIYHSVLNTCVYKTGDHKQAVQIFDSMKFLSGSMAPGPSQYQDIIVSYINNNDVEKALDLYEDMLSKNVPTNQKILVALARGCAMRKQMRLRAWDFIFEIYEQGWEPTIPTLEYMIYLAAKDGDLSLSRALYQRLNVSESLSPRSFGFLMLAYAHSGATYDIKKYTVPAVLVHERGKNFRRNLIDKTTFTPNMNNPKTAVPFLPMNSLMSANELLSESSAVMAHSVLVNPALVSQASVDMFMDIAAKLGSLEEFIDRYNQFTYFDDEGVPITSSVSLIEELPSSHKQSDTNMNTDAQDGKEKISTHTKSPILSPNVKGIHQLRFPRTTKTYCIALQAAAKSRNYEFSQMIWQERGLYRKSKSFRSLDANKRKDFDFQFAATMVHCLTEMELLDDALAILVSTEYQFKWTWKELKPLHAAAVKLGHDKITKTVRGIASRAQVNFEGKIKRSDFKKYVSVRGF